jgi:hypothetical protein
MSNFCKIDSNVIEYLEDDNRLNKYTYDNFEDAIEDFTTFINYETQDELHEVISDIFSAQTVYTTNVYETETVVYQMCHLSTFANVPEFKEINDSIILKKKNKIADLLCNYLYNVYGPVILMKSIIDQNNVRSEKITMDDITYILRKKKVHTGILLDDNNNITELEYMVHPMSWETLPKLNNYKFYEIEMFGRILMFYIELVPTNNSYNLNANRIFAKSITATTISADTNSKYISYYTNIKYKR